MKNKIILLSLIGILLVGAITYLIQSKSVSQNKENQLSITASFYPYYFFASEIGGNKVNVVNITPAGSEPHDYEPTSTDIVQIESSRLLVINGAVEPWANKIMKNLIGKQTKILEVGKGLFNLEFIDEDGEKVEDPHVWLSPRLAKVQVELILKALVESDSENKTYYEANARKLLQELDLLDQKFKKGLSTCKFQNIVTSHAAFGYLAKEYGLDQTTITGISPDEEPSLKRLAEIAEFVKKNNIKYIFFESLVSPKLAQTLASETGAQALELNPIEGLTVEEISQGKNYLTVMEDNLHNLRIALECN